MIWPGQNLPVARASRLTHSAPQGTSPDGSSYADPGSFGAYFDGGDAVHYFPRGSYGFEQSLGCAELRYGTAGTAGTYLTYGEPCHRSGLT